MTAQPLPELYTLEDYRHWEGDWELIRGIALAMAPSPALNHQRLGGRIYSQLVEALEDCPHCEALYEIDIEFAQDTVVRPDVILICYEPEGERLTRAPELIFEVISPATARRDEQTKFQLYREEGVSCYVSWSIRWRPRPRSIGWWMATIARWAIFTTNAIPSSCPIAALISISGACGARVLHAKRMPV